MPGHEPEDLPLDATPSKRIYLSIISDYDLKTAVCELLDNVLDAHRSLRSADILAVDIEIDVDQQTISLCDNAGGVPKGELRKLISPGETTSDGAEGAIGNFGVGSKRAVVALAEHIRVTTRRGNEDTYRLEYDDEWLTSPDWHLPYFKVANIEPNTTTIQLSRLRSRISDGDVSELKEHVSMVYAHFLKNPKTEFRLQGELIEPHFFDQWAYPASCPPVAHKKQLFDQKTQAKVNFRLVSGLTYQGGTIEGDYGVFVYCNKRLVTRALRSPEVGFIAGLAGQSHHDKSLARIIVELDGPANLMPWNSSKTAIFYNHRIFSLIKDDIITSVKHATKSSKLLRTDFETKVAPFREGRIIENDLGLQGSIKLTKLPTFEAMSQKETIETLNKSLGYEKPWTRGLYETMIAEQLIAGRKVLTQKNRISLILLDSTVEIGCKEYLDKVVKLAPKDVEKLKRWQIQNEVAKHVLTDDPIWDRLREYYRYRNTFVHESASLTVPDTKISEIRLDVSKFLTAAFGIQFP